MNTASTDGHDDSKPQGARCRVRAATRDDCGLIVQLIRDLAEYEREPQAAIATEEMIRSSIFGDAYGIAQRMGPTINGVKRSGPVAECLIGEVSSEDQVGGAWRAEGFALFFMNYSTWLGRPGVYLEDLFVRPASRGVGLGKSLFVEIARIAIARGCERMEWNVLDWNTPAIDFYRSLGAKGMDEWTIHRLAGDALRKIGGV